MKKLAAALLFGKDSRLSGLIAFAIVGAIALGCTCNKELGNLGKSNDSERAPASNTTTEAPSKADASSGEVPTDRQAQELARTTLMDFNDAIQKDNFEDFHRTMSKPFQKQASPERLREGFKVFVDANIDFSTARHMTAEFSPSPSVEKKSGINHLQLKGFYPTSPRKTNFDFKYIPEGDEWKLISIEVNTKDQ